LPVELNLIIEEVVVSDYTHPSQQNNYKRLVDYDKERNQRLANLVRFQDYLKNLEKKKENYLANIQEALSTEMFGIQQLREKARKEKEIEKLLAKEIKEYQAK